MNNNANNGFSSPNPGYGNQTAKFDNVMQDVCNKNEHLNQLTPDAKKDPNLEDNLEIKIADVIDLDEDHGNTIKCPAKTSGYNDYTLGTGNQSSFCERDNKEPMAFGCERSFYVPEETSLLKHTVATGKPTFQENLTKTKVQNVQELPVLRSMNVTTSTWKKETLTIGGISKQATRLASGTGPQTFHNLNSLSGEFLYGPGNITSEFKLHKYHVHR